MLKKVFVTMLKNILNKYSKKNWKCAEKKTWSARSDKSEEEKLWNRH